MDHPDNGFRRMDWKKDGAEVLDLMERLQSGILEVADLGFPIEKVGKQLWRHRNFNDLIDCLKQANYHCSEVLNPRRSA